MRSFPSYIVDLCPLFFPRIVKISMVMKLRQSSTSKMHWVLTTLMQLQCIWKLVGGFSGKGLKLGIVMGIRSSIGAGISEIDLCFNSCVWRSFILSSTLEACF